MPPKAKSKAGSSRVGSVGSSPTTRSPIRSPMVVKPKSNSMGKANSNPIRKATSNMKTSSSAMKNISNATGRTSNCSRTSSLVSQDGSRRESLGSQQSGRLSMGKASVSKATSSKAKSKTGRAFHSSSPTGSPNRKPVSSSEKAASSTPGKGGKGKGKAVLSSSSASKAVLVSGRAASPSDKKMSRTKSSRLLNTGNLLGDSSHEPTGSPLSSLETDGVENTDAAQIKTENDEDDEEEEDEEEAESEEDLEDLDVDDVEEIEDEEIDDDDGYLDHEYISKYIRDLGDDIENGIDENNGGDVEMAKSGDVKMKNLDDNTGDGIIDIMDDIDVTALNDSTDSEEDLLDDSNPRNWPTAKRQAHKLAKAKERIRIAKAKIEAMKTPFIKKDVSGTTGQSATTNPFKRNASSSDQQPAISSDHKLNTSSLLSTKSLVSEQFLQQSKSFNSSGGSVGGGSVGSGGNGSIQCGLINGNSTSGSGLVVGTNINHGRASQAMRTTTTIGSVKAPTDANLVESGIVPVVEGKNPTGIFKSPLLKAAVSDDRVMESIDMEMRQRTGRMSETGSIGRSRSKSLNEMDDEIYPYVESDEELIMLDLPEMIDTYFRADSVDIIWNPYKNYTEKNQAINAAFDELERRDGTEEKRRLNKERLERIRLKTGLLTTGLLSTTGDGVSFTAGDGSEKIGIEKNPKRLSSPKRLLTTEQTTNPGRRLSEDLSGDMDMNDKSHNLESNLDSYDPYNLSNPGHLKRYIQENPLLKPPQETNNPYSLEMPHSEPGVHIVYLDGAHLQLEAVETPIVGSLMAFDANANCIGVVSKLLTGQSTRFDVTKVDGTEVELFEG